jgi:GNAT superfamily N-acetyltransferase
MSMYTEPEFRRKGFATLIVKEAMSWARRNGYARMSLHASKAGRSVYDKLGWERSWEMRVDLEETKNHTGRAHAVRART